MKELPEHLHVLRTVQLYPQHGRGITTLLDERTKPGTALPTQRNLVFSTDFSLHRSNGATEVYPGTMPCALSASNMCSLEMVPCLGRITTVRARLLVVGDGSLEGSDSP
jgi:hypothetical protein